MKNKILILIFLSIFVFYSVSVFAYNQGYYKNHHQRAKELTDQQIMEFEKDIRDGKSIDLTKYVLYDEKNYQTKASKSIYKISLKIEKAVDIFVRFIFNKASKSIND